MAVLMSCRVRSGCEPNFLDRGQSAPRPFRQEAEEHFGTGSRARDFVHIGHGIGDEEPYSLLVEICDVAFFFDGVAEAHALGADAEPEELVQLPARGHVEVGAEIAQERDHFVVGIGLDRVVYLRERHVSPEFLVLGLDDIEVDDETGGFLVLGELLDPLELLTGHEIFERKTVLIFQCSTSG